MSTANTLFAATSEAIKNQPDLRRLEPKTKRRMARHSARAVAKWWPKDYTPDYVEANQAVVTTEAAKVLEQELVVGFGGIVPWLVGSLISMVAQWIIKYIITWLLGNKTTAFQAIQQAKGIDSAESDTD